MASAFNNNGKGEIMKGNIDLESDTIKIAFMDEAYVFDKDADDNYDDISASIASGSTDQTLANKAVNIDDVNDRAEFDADDIALTSQTISGGTDGVIIYKDTGVASTSTVIAWVEFAEGTLTPVNGDLDINWNSEGIFAF